MEWRRIFAALTLVGLPIVSAARDYPDVGISLGLWTQHLNPGKDTNEYSQLVAFSYSNYVAGRFINSYDDETFFGGKRFHTDKFRSLKYENFFIQGNLYLGLIHGYGDRFLNLGGASPGILPTLGIGYKKTSLELLYIPTPAGGVFMSVITWRRGS